MGEVYRARDSKLNRDVAIKVLPADLANDAQYMARFEREAQILAALNHPNIATVYGIEQGALVMELVEGADLRGPLPLEEAIPIARQIAEGLEAAHERNIIHRDLKPANIKLTPAGVVKILDFGLAKAAGEFSAATPGASPTLSPTLSLAMTQAGTILGTAAYMSPEQARGKPVDKRADIWAFGVVLFELLAGRQVFGGGETVTDIIAAVVTREPDWNALPANTPAYLRRLIERCLRKDPKLRLRDIGEARILIDEPAPAPSAAVTAAPAPRRPWPWIGAAAVFALAALVLALLYFGRPAEEPHAIKLHILAPEKSNFTTDCPAVSPDGRRVAFTAVTDGKLQLWVRDLDSLAARSLPGTEGASYPFWSPDSRSIAFFAAGHLKKIDAAGGPALALCETTLLHGGTWSQNGVIVFGRGYGLFRVPAAGGTAIPVTTLDQEAGESRHAFPWFLPDGHRFLYLAVNTDREKLAIWVADLNSKERRRVMPAASNAVYSPPGFLLFTRERTLMAQPFDASTAQTTGDAVPVAEPLDDFFISSGSSSPSRFSVSRNGVLVYNSGIAGAARQLT